MRRQLLFENVCEKKTNITDANAVFIYVRVLQMSLEKALFCQLCFFEKGNNTQTQVVACRLDAIIRGKYKVHIFYIFNNNNGSTLAKSKKEDATENDAKPVARKPRKRVSLNQVAAEPKKQRKRKRGADDSEDDDEVFASATKDKFEFEDLKGTIFFLCLPIFFQ